MPDVPFDVWERCLREDYLAAFLRDGGAAVKVVVADDRTRNRVRDALRDASEEYNVRLYDLCDSDPPIDLHSIDQLWFAIARKTDWEELVARFVRSMMAEQGYPIDDPAIPATLPMVRKVYDRSDSDIKSAFRDGVNGKVEHNYEISAEFRTILSELCRSYFTDTHLESRGAKALAWLKGFPQMLRDLKTIEIFRKINRTFARDIIASFCHWHLSVSGPMMIVVDIADYFALRDGGRKQYRHSRAQILQLYEVMREFVDEIQNMEGVFVAFLAPPELVTSQERSYAIYHALRTRIADEVRDRLHGNPCGTLVTVS